VDWQFEPSMEAMSDEDIKERIRRVYEYEIPAKIRPIPYIGDKREVVTYSSEELVARCPVTGLPDFYKIAIEFVPDETIPELKSLKYYLLGYLDLPISHEHLVSKVYRDLEAAVRPSRLRITLDVAVRGGITTRVVLGEL